MLNHIGITINDEHDIANFYQKILGFEIIKTFSITADLAEEIFHLREGKNIYLLKKNDVYLEVFVEQFQTSHRFNHICLNVTNRNEILIRAKENNYSCNVIPRQDYDLNFVSDRSANMFELKEIGK